MKSLLIFTDLDGTLLDHDSYRWDPAQAALNQIRERNFPLIFNSSKTRPEIETLRRRMENRHPFIVENGSAVYVPEGYFPSSGALVKGGYERHLFGPARDEILTILHQLRTQAGFRFRGFNDLSVPQLAEITGLTHDQANQAMQRDCSEPIQWQEESARLDEFRRALASHGLRLLRGGRFRHVMGDTDKVAGIRWLIDRYRGCWPENEFVSVALGDSPNDLGMLEAVDIPVVIDPARGEPLRLERPGRVIYAGAKGPQGWQLAMDQILKEY
jgi:mannosyl-3-phosphoglycerate phosphatase